MPKFHQLYDLPLLCDRVEPTPAGYLLEGAQVSLLHTYGTARYFRHGFHSWSLTSWLDLAEPLPTPTLKIIWPHLDDLSMLENYPFCSSGVGALQAPDGQILLLGALGLDAYVKADAHSLHGEAVQPTTWFLAKGNEDEVFARYAALLADQLGARGQAPAPNVWCSWYSFFTKISEPVMLATLEGVRGFPFDVFQVDDGWQIAHGDWEANEKFPGGMASMAGRIAEAGFTPGLWMAPFIVQPKSRLIREHPEWLLRDETGRPVSAGHNWGDYFYALNVTHPEVQAWLAQLIGRVRDWGFHYLKLDFLYAAALPGVRAAGMPPQAAYRQAMEIVRHAAGDDYILACGAPALASVGLVDGLRVGPDSAPFWDNEERSRVLHDYTGPSTLNAIRTSLHRLWMRPLFHIDPDIVFFRERYNLLQPDERALLQNLALIAGFRATSDLPAWLDEDERQALVAFLRADPKIEKLSRYGFSVDGRPIDYSFVQLT